MELTVCFEIKIILQKDHGITLSERAPHKSRSLWDRHNFTRHDPPVLYVPDGHEVCSVPGLSLLGSQLYLYKRLAIKK